jgi:hypothetical protein
LTTLAEYIHGAHRYQVAALRIVVRLTSGSEIYLARHATLPANADTTHVEHLLRSGLIRMIGEDV